VRLEVAKTGGKELFAWPGSKNFQDRPIGAFVPGGLIGDGVLQGRSAMRIDYVVRPTKKSAFKIATEGGSAALGYSGSWWADSETLDLKGDYASKLGHRVHL
jgi:hypothetical protein